MLGVLDAACKELKTWQEAGWKDMCITVNVSARQFRSDSTLIENITESLEKHNITSESLQLELTEGVLMKETQEAVEIIKAIKDKGIKLLIDDFGTGYSSLSYLQRYEFDSIKIDRSYINNVLSHDKDAKLVKAVIAMANGLGMSVVSEGVETKGQLDFLLEAKCEFTQGYYFSKPVAADEFIPLLQKFNPINGNGESLKLITGMA